MKLTFPPASHQISACARLTTLLLNATLLEHISPPPPAIVIPVPLLNSSRCPLPDPDPDPTAPASFPPTAVAVVGTGPVEALSVNRPIFKMRAGSRPLSVGPTPGTDAAATEGLTP